MRNHFHSIVVAAALAIPTLASADVEVQSVAHNKVLLSYDVDQTATEKGRAVLERRIRRAAEQVCGPQDLRTAGTLDELIDNRKCFKNSVARAMRAVNSSGSVVSVSSTSN